ncbi:PorT protein [Flavobacterium cauense R2A-7]|uniref:Outer membrane protein with beta-barrel domain n=1 Tax=Flavobacterium cauense R2A-7 TaxID=1341154 RepID=V6S5C7_9FLAO|nr:porin family protein [Flavobacterium cauense]ESU21629.1 PorT protein [Flavobacterium cauense R2A-7]KGO80125.1 PorT protein [Flavobacterium cauense R2A-7]TWI10434.1 outer membrane protein with beta-barrel domain [Flavobacterium cauense R2A-7]
MKKLFVLLVFIVSANSFGQKGLGMFGKDPIINLENFDKQRVHWGYYLGFNSYDFKFDYIEPDKDIEVQSTTGFNVGLIGNLRIMEYIDLRFEPGLYYAQRNLTYPNIEDSFDRLREVKSTYIHFPLLLKFSSKRIGNIRPYIVGGLSQSMNLGSNSKAKDDNYNERFRMQKMTSNYELGFGIDLYFEYFKFSPSIRGVFGLKDELIRDNTPDSPWTGNVASMKTRGIFINFAFH